MVFQNDEVHTIVQSEFLDLVFQIEISLGVNPTNTSYKNNQRGKQNLQSLIHRH